MQTWSLAVLTTSCVLAACGANPPPADPDAVGLDASTTPQLAATLTPDTVTAGEYLTLAVEIDNFEVVNPQTTPAEPGKGHFHYQPDWAENYTAAWTTSLTVTTAASTPTGEHTLRIWLVDGNHVEISPLVETTLTFTVE